MITMIIWAVLVAITIVGMLGVISQIGNDLNDLKEMVDELEINLHRKLQVMNVDFNKFAGASGETIASGFNKIGLYGTPEITEEGNVKIVWMNKKELKAWENQQLKQVKQLKKETKNGKSNKTSNRNDKPNNKVFSKTKKRA